MDRSNTNSPHKAREHDSTITRPQGALPARHGQLADECPVDDPERWQSKDRRFARLAKIYDGPELAVLTDGSDFQIKRHGEDSRFAGSVLRVPGNLLRDRVADVQVPEDLAKRHRAYRYRIMMGPSYRADMWSTLELEPAISVPMLARRCYGSFATAWHVRRDFSLVEHTPTRGDFRHEQRKPTPMSEVVPDRS